VSPTVLFGINEGMGRASAADTATGRPSSSRDTNRYWERVRGGSGTDNRPFRASFHGRQGGETGHVRLHGAEIRFYDRSRPSPEWRRGCDYCWAASPKWHGSGARGVGPSAVLEIGARQDGSPIKGRADFVAVRVEGQPSPGRKSYNLRSVFASAAFVWYVVPTGTAFAESFRLRTFLNLRDVYAILRCFALDWIFKLDDMSINLIEHTG